MTDDYEIIPEPTPRSRLGRPGIANLARRLVYELERSRGIVPVRERMELARLRSLIDRLLRDLNEVQVD